jgi:hypothetical protein
MKKFEELTEKELLNLTEGEISFYIKLKMAEEGVKFLKEIEEPKYEEIPPYDSKAYVVGVLMDAVVFNNIKDAETVADTLRKIKMHRLRTDYNSGDYIKYKEEVDKPAYDWDFFDIRVIDSYSPELYKEVKKLIKYNKELEKNYKNEFEKYQEEIRKRQIIENSILDKISEVKEKYDKLDNYASIFYNEYLPLAENNKDLAMKFMKKAYNLTKDEEEYIFKNDKTK